jgi:hypothetical protein
MGNTVSGDGVLFVTLRNRHWPYRAAPRWIETSGSAEWRASLGVHRHTPGHMFIQVGPGRRSCGPDV